MIKYLLILCMMISLFLGGALFGINQASENHTDQPDAPILSEESLLEGQAEKNDMFEGPVVGIPVETPLPDKGQYPAHGSVQIAELLGTGISKLYDIVITTAANIVEPLF
ncbi:MULTISPECIES: hypothetical protein [Thalassobacillus]|uniref:hypothetical protein n=1 Tax=Thalassobacillus TaxID=331971 RepID=UPI000A1C7DEC|nr:hypothetical protein [Thalassobacillus devorans]